MSLTGWDVSGWVIATAATITACGVIWQKVVKPLRAAWKAIKAWMARVEASVSWTEQQMKPNGGSTLVDKVNVMQGQVSLLLRHDAERDTAGKRYGDSEPPREDTP